MDGQVAQPSDPELAALMDKFVCIRMVDIDGIDLQHFDYDTDQSWSVMFLNVDGTVYGRYGSRSSRDASKDISIEGLKQAAAAALELHKGYPGNRQRLVGKVGKKPRWATPDSIPMMRGKNRGCYHCHQIQEAQVRSQWMNRTPIADSLLWKFPMPDVLGLSMDGREKATIDAVDAGSVAEKAGFKTQAGTRP